MIVDHLGNPITRQARRHAIVRVIPSKFMRGRPVATEESDAFERLASDLRRREQTRQRTRALRLE